MLRCSFRAFAFCLLSLGGALCATTGPSASRATPLGGAGAGNYVARNRLVAARGSRPWRHRSFRCLRCPAAHGRQVPVEGDQVFLVPAAPVLEKELAGHECPMLEDRVGICHGRPEPVVALW